VIESGHLSRVVSCPFSQLQVYAILSQNAVCDREIMAAQKDKTVSYRRAEWFSADHQAGVTLATCLKQAGAKLQSVSERTIILHDGKYIRLASMHREGEGYYLHFTADTPGEAASIVPKVTSTTKEIKVSTVKPPKDAEFMDGDAFLYVSGNDVCMCTTSMGDGSVRYFLQKFFEAAHIGKDATLFDLMKVSNMSKVKLIKSEGVKEIELRTTLYEASVHYHRRKKEPSSIMGAAAKQLKYVLGNEHDVNHDALRMMLTVKTDERRSGIKLGEKRIQELAKGMVDHQEEEDEYVIITNGGYRIGPKEIFMKSTVKIDSIGKSVDRDKAWEELFRFYNVLKESGALEQ